MVFNKSDKLILSRADIETEAYNILSAFDVNLLKQPAAIPIEDIIERHYKLNFEYQVLSKEEENILGLTAFTPGYLEVYDAERNCSKKINVQIGTIIIDERLALDENKVGRFRFTCAHEAAHWYLHRHMYLLDENQTSLFGGTGESKVVSCLHRDIESKCAFRGRNKTDLEWLEWQADCLASALLMPEKAYQNAYKNMANKIGYNSGCTNYNPSDRKMAVIIEALAELFQVSKQAARIRLFNLSILKNSSNHEILLDY